MTKDEVNKLGADLRDQAQELSTYAGKAGSKNPCTLQQPQSIGRPAGTIHGMVLRTTEVADSGDEVRMLVEWSHNNQALQILRRRTA